MSASGMISTVLATQLSEAAQVDERDEGLDISAGLYGSATSRVLRETAAEIERLQSINTEMADALEGVLRVADRNTKEFDAVRAALKKAGR